MTLRAYSPADREGCLRIFDTNVPCFFRDEERPEFSVFLDALPGPYFVMVDPERAPVACGGYALREDTAIADLCWGMVRREDHRRGLGRLLTEARIDRIRRDPRVAVVALNTSQHTAPFYERLGFRTLRTEPDGYGPGLDRFEMALELNP